MIPLRYAYNLTREQIDKTNHNRANIRTFYQSMTSMSVRNSALLTCSFMYFTPCSPHGITFSTPNLRVLMVRTGFGKSWKVMEIENAIFQDLESF